MVAPVSPHIPSRCLERLQVGLSDKITLYVLSFLCIISAVICIVSWCLGASAIVVLPCLSVFLMLSGVLFVALYYAGRCFLFHSSSVTTNLSLPEPFLCVLRELYPEALYNFCVGTKASIQDLRVVLEALTTGEMCGISVKIKRDMEIFGLKHESFPKDLPSLDSVLIKNCPWQFVLHFISLGDEQVSREAGMSPEVYWTRGLGQDGDDHLFNHFTWLFSHVVTRDEYEQLLLHTNDQGIHTSQTSLLKSLAKRMRDLFQGVENDLTKKQKKALRDSIVRDYRELLFDLLRLRMNWQQIQLFRCLLFNHAYLFSLYNFVIEDVIDEISESSSHYDPELALLTWDDGDPLGVAEERRLMGVL